MRRGGHAEGVASPTGEQEVTPTMRVTRVLNNAVMVESSGEVRIVLGKAIGYGLKPGDLVDPDRVTETFAPDGSWTAWWPSSPRFRSGSSGWRARSSSGRRPI